MTLLGGKTTAVVALACASLVFIGSESNARGQRRAVSLEYDTDRPGSDYNNFVVQDAQACRIRCADDDACRAFTFVRAGIQGPYARCYLKKAVPQRRADRCCISGVKQ